MSAINALNSDKSTMNFGVVKINNRNYNAVLHYQSQDGTPQEIRDSMLNAPAQ